MREILEPTVRGLAADGIDYRGVLYAGVMVDAPGAPWLLEYNCRFGDPETQPIMARMRRRPRRGARGRGARRAAGTACSAGTRASRCASSSRPPGYPGAPTTGDRDRGSAPCPTTSSCSTPAPRERDGALVSAGGRVLGVTALGISVEQARERAYAVVDAIELAGKQVAPRHRRAQRR